MLTLSGVREGVLVNYRPRIFPVNILFRLPLVTRTSRPCFLGLKFLIELHSSPLFMDSQYGSSSFHYSYTLVLTVAS